MKSPICAKRPGADVQEVARGIGLDKRIGTSFCHAGSRLRRLVLSQDTLALLKTGQDEGAPLRIVETVVAVNDARKRAMARKVMHALGGSGARQRVALLGLAFKPNTDQICANAPSLGHPSPRSLATGRKSTPTIPESMDQARPLMPEAVFFDDA